MKKQMTAVFCFLSLFATAAPGNMIGQMTQNEGLAAVPAVRNVRIDGNLDEWDLSGEIWSFADFDVRDQYSVRTAAMWDRDNLYLAFTWKDPTPLNSTIDPDFDSSRGWVADAVQLRVAAGGQVSWITSWCSNGNRPCLTINYWNSSSSHKNTTNRLYKAAPGGTILGDGIESAYRKLPDNSGFIHEMRIPWNVIYKHPFTAKAGDRIQMGLEFKWGDVTGSGNPAHSFSDNMSKGSTSRSFYWTKTAAWGDLTLVSAPLSRKREYRRSASKPQGSIEIKAQVPADAAVFSLVIEDKDGKRIRNLASGFAVEDYKTGAPKNGKQEIRVLWDGLDDAGRLAAPGICSVRGISHKGLSSNYVMSFYNPGTPPWGTPDGKGGWGSDHSRPEFVARSGKNMIVATNFVEGGYGIWALGPDGRKIWSEKRGATHLAANSKYVYSVPNDWYTKEDTLYRYNAEDGSYAPFVRDGKKRPFNLPFREILGVKELKTLFPKKENTTTGIVNISLNPAILAIAAGPENILVALADGIVAEIDGETGEKLREYKLDYDWLRIENAASINNGYFDKLMTPLAFDGKTIWFFKKGNLTRFDTATGKTGTVKLERKVELPCSLALGTDGSIYIADRGRDMQVKRFSVTGTFLGAFGKQGGRPRAGTYDEQGMREMSSVGVDDRGRVWTAEFTDYPRRVSVWKPDGRLDREYIGNTGYSGTGAILHDSDPGRAFVGVNEMKLDLKNHTWKMTHILWNPEPDACTFRPGTGGHDAGHVFYSTASGKKREYYFRPSMLLMNDNGSWRPVSGIVTVGELQRLFSRRIMVKEPYGEFAGLNPCDTLIWNDDNGDGLIQRAECEIIPAKRKAVIGKTGIPGKDLCCGWGQRMDPADLSFYMYDRNNMDRWKISPVGFHASGAPRYGSGKMEKIAVLRGAEARDMVPVPGENVVLSFGEIDRRPVLFGMSKQGKMLWNYPDPYNSVHGSHKAVMPRPGLLIGPLKVAGIVPECGDAQGVFLIRGNLGQDFYLTTDGIYVDSMFRDTRLPGAPLPADEDALRGMPFRLFSMGGEPFNGWIGRQSDGAVRMLCGIAGQAASLINVNGLDTIRRFTAPSVTVSAADLVKADRANSLRKTAAQKTVPYTIARVQGAPVWQKIKGMKLEVEGQPAKGECRLAYNAATLFARFTISDSTPWINGGDDVTRMFKTGDCVDLQLSPSGNRNSRAAEGDLRLLTAPFGKRNAAILMRRLWNKAQPKESVRYQSPVGIVEYAQVKELPSVKTTVRKTAESYTVELAIPWSELGIVPVPGGKLRGDAGFILSDSEGKLNVARIYYANKNTNLVNDLPMEAEIHPSAWADFELGK